MGRIVKHTVTLLGDLTLAEFPDGHFEVELAKPETLECRCFAKTFDPQEAELLFGLFECEMA